MCLQDHLNSCFHRKAVFEFDLPEDKNIEDIELELIEAGLEEIEKYDGYGFMSMAIIQISAHCHMLLKIWALEVKRLLLKDCRLTRSSSPRNSLTDIEKLIDRIEDDDDVQAVYTNIA